MYIRPTQPRHLDCTIGSSSWTPCTTSGIYTSPSLAAILLAISLHRCTRYSALSYLMLWMLTHSQFWLLPFTPCSPGPCRCPLGKAHNVCAVRSRTWIGRLDRINKLIIEIPDSPRAAVIHGRQKTLQFRVPSCTWMHS